LATESSIEHPHRAGRMLIVPPFSSGSRDHRSGRCAVHCQERTSFSIHALSIPDRAVYGGIELGDRRIRPRRCRWANLDRQAPCSACAWSGLKNSFARRAPPWLLSLCPLAAWRFEPTLSAPARVAIDAVWVQPKPWLGPTYLWKVHGPMPTGVRRHDKNPIIPWPKTNGRL